MNRKKKIYQMLMFHGYALNYTEMNVVVIDSSRAVQWCKSVFLLVPTKIAVPVENVCPQGAAAWRFVC